MIKIDPEYIDIFNKYWGLNTFTSMVSLIVLLHVMIFITAFSLYMINKNKFKNQNSKKNKVKINIKLRNVTTYVCAIVLVPLALAFTNPKSFEPRNGPLEFLAKHQYQNKYDVKIQSNKHEFEKEKEKLPEFNVTTLIKTSDGLFQAKLAEKPEETYGVKKAKLSVNKVTNQTHKKKQECKGIIKCEVEKKNFTISVIELPTEKGKPIIAKINLFEDEDLKGVYIVEINYEDLSYILENKNTVHYQQGSNDVHFE